MYIDDPKYQTEQEATCALIDLLIDVSLQGGMMFERNRYDISTILARYPDAMHPYTRSKLLELLEFPTLDGES